MNREGYIAAIVVAAIFLSRFVFRKNTHNNTTSSASESEASSSYADSEGKYDVFLSFRGADTRHGFTDHLYNGLVNAGIYTFRDSEKLQIGEEIGLDLLKAIEDSKIWIPIFSKNYAESKWCLIEFAHIVKCRLENEKLKIYPVFYDVDVDHVKKQQGSYEKAFRGHEKNFDEKTVRDWRDALKTVGKFKGYDLKTETNGHEGLLVKKLVKNVLLELKKNHMVVGDVVGMDHHLQEMRRLLKVESDGVRIVGVHGMGGIGKTTIAKAIFNQLCDGFDGCCFLEDVRESAKHPDGLVHQQKKLLSQISKKDFPDIVVDDDDGVKKIRDVVHRKKVLIVLDDVDEKTQFDKLAGECNWFNKASRIIVTTRNEEVLNALKATCIGVGLHETYASYKPKLLRFSDSLKLFSKYAFMRDHPPEGYVRLSKRVRSIAAGLPLVLVTLGSSFLGVTDKALWVAKLKKLEKVPNKDVMGKLKISFDPLNDDEKKIFLDIACLFIGKDKTKPNYMWEDCDFVPEDGISTLVLRSLVEIRDDNKLRMHDQLRDLGRKIAQEENMYKLSRMWHPKEALNVLDGGLGVENVEALNLDLPTLNSYEYEKLTNVIKQEYKELRIGRNKHYVRRLKGQSFNMLQNLRFLQLGCVIFDKDFNNPLSNLRWLEWRCCEKFIPTKLNLENLVILNLSNSTITDEWEGWIFLKVAKKLKALNLSSCSGLIRGPNFFNFKDLESLVLHSCESLSEVSGLNRLKSLTILNLKGCKSIVRLPDLSKLRRLRKLILEKCKMLNSVDGLQGLLSLEHLVMTDCESIERLTGLSNLTMLKTIHVDSCGKLCEIEGLGGLESLEYLNMCFCRSIVRLPNLSNLRMLKTLNVQACGKLCEIEGLGGLESLEYLNMNFCESIVTLPNLSNLRMLKTLALVSCQKLVEVDLGGLVCLEKLNMVECISIDRLPNLSHLGKLTYLSLNFCKKLHEIEGLSGLISLEELLLSFCFALNNSLDFSCLKNLKTLRLRKLEHWTEIKGLEELKSLELLDVSDCSSLEKLPDLRNFPMLDTICSEGCTKLLYSWREDEIHVEDLES